MAVCCCPPLVQPPGFTWIGNPPRQREGNEKDRIARRGLKLSFAASGSCQSNDPEFKVTFIQATCCQAFQKKADLRTMPRWARRFLLRKEVIQPQVPLRLPCYDFIPVTSFTLGPYDTSGATGFHDVTGGVYKTRERIHGTVADVPLLAIPTSWRRVAASNPNWAQFYGFPPPRGLGSNCTEHCSTCAALGVRAILT